LTRRRQNSCNHFLYCKSVYGLFEFLKQKGIAMSGPTAGFKTCVTATLAVRQWAQAVEFYKTAFGATELHRVPGGGVVQLSVRGAEFWVAEESTEHLNFSPESLGGCSVRMLLVVEDPAAVCEKAVAAGATQVYPVSDAHGWRIGRIVDPSGHHWEVAKPLTCGQILNSGS
jgi:PhnB protein